MNQLLNQFNNDVHTRDEVIDFIHEFINQESLKRVYERADVSGIADAKELIDLAFSSLDDIYGIRNKTPVSKNQSK